MTDDRTCSVGLKFELEEVDSCCNTRGVIKHARDKRKIISSLISLARVVFRTYFSRACRIPDLFLSRVSYSGVTGNSPLPVGDGGGGQFPRNLAILGANFLGYSPLSRKFPPLYFAQCFVSSEMCITRTLVALAMRNQE